MSLSYKDPLMLFQTRSWCLLVFVLVSDVVQVWGPRLSELCRCDSVLTCPAGPDRTVISEVKDLFSRLKCLVSVS